jgi:short-subunit dehydrogenase
MELTGAHVLITGASRGLGAGLAREFAAAGAGVTVVARTREAIEALAGEISGTALAADLLDRAQVSGLVARAEGAAGAPVDVLVNNAGLDLTQPLDRFTHAELSRIAELNLVVPLELSRQAVAGMAERGRGHIVNISSLAGTAALPGMLPYAATKAALTHATSGLRAELKGLPVGTTVVEVGLVPTGMRESVLAHAPTAAAFRRLYRLGALCDTPLERLCRATVRAVAADRRHVRLPRRALPFALLAESPRRTVEWLTTGVRPRR